MKKLNWGILSTGKIASEFAKGLARSDSGTLVGVGSRTRESAEAFAEQFGVPKAFDRYEDLLDDPEIEAVYIATPHPLHKQWAIAAANAKKHVLCEKPIGMNATEAKAIIDAAEGNGVFLMEAFMYRCHPQTRKIVELVSSGALGGIQLVQASFGFQAAYNPASRLFNRELGGGGILDIGCYPVSFSRLIAGAASGHSFENPNHITAAAHIGQSGVDELATATLEFPSGLIAQVSCSIKQFHDNHTRVFGTEGWLDIPWPWSPAKYGGDSTIYLHRPVRGGEEVVEEILHHTDAWIYQIEADHVAKHVAEGQSPAMSWSDTLGNMQALDAWRARIGLEYPADSVL